MQFENFAELKVILQIHMSQQFTQCFEMIVSQMKSSKSMKKPVKT